MAQVRAGSGCQSSGTRCSEAEFCGGKRVCGLYPIFYFVLVLVLLIVQLVGVVTRAWFIRTNVCRRTHPGAHNG